MSCASYSQTTVLALAGAILLARAEADLTLGVLLPSDPMAAESMKQGVELAVSQFSTPGLRIRAVMRPRGSQWGTEGQEAAEMALDEGARAIIAPADGASAHLALQVAGRTGIPVVTLCEDSSVLGAGIPWSLRIAPGTREQALTLFTNGLAQRWCAIVTSNREGREASRDLREAARLCQQELTIVSEATVPASVATALARRPDGIMVWTREQAGAQKIAHGLREAKYEGLIAIPCSIAPSNCEAVAAGIATDAKSESRFIAQFRDRFQNEPDPTAIFAYDAARVLIALLAGEDGDSSSTFRNRAERLRARGASGPIQFDATGSRTTPLRVQPASQNRGRTAL